jgi:FkbM family methyltransferase
MKREIRVGDRTCSFESDDNYLARMPATFEPHMVRLFRALIRPGMAVADVGANIGMTAVLFSQLARRVQAFEPAPSTHALLVGNILGNGCDNVEAVNLGFGDRAGTETLTFAATNRSGGFVSDKVRPEAGYRSETIRIETLDGFFGPGGAPPPDFIKIDVEGFEPRVIRGGQRMLAAARPVVVMEMNHFCLNVMQRVTLPDFLDLVRATFPVAIAVDSDNHRMGNLHEPEAAYAVMHAHVTGFRYPNLVCGFDIGLHRVLARLRAGRA